MAEALFKAFGKALDMATMEEPRMNGVWSRKAAYKGEQNDEL